MRFSVVLVFAVLYVLAVSALADVYRYTDNKGELHFVDDIAKVPKKYRKQITDAELQGNVSIMAATPALRESQERTVKELPEEQAMPPAGTNVEVFVTSWCGYCKKMLRFLNEKGIPYTAYDIETDRNAFRIYRELGGGGVPVVRIGANVVRGFNPDKVMAYYAKGK